VWGEVVRILVTGGAGFLGSHLSENLLNRGHSVTVLDDLSTGRLERVPARAEFFKVNINESIVDIARDQRPNVVIHLAAQVSVPTSVLDPAHDLTLNGVGTVRVMEAAHKSGAKKFITVSSAAVYGHPADVPVTESSPTLAESPYGLSKLTSEAYVRLLGKQWGLPYTVIRPANIFGPGQRPKGEGAVIPTFLEAFLEGRDPVIHGDGLQTRDFIFVSDVVELIINTLTQADGAILNVSSNTATPILDLWNMIAQSLGWERSPKFGAPREGDIRHSVMDNNVARMLVGWQPTVTFEGGLQETIKWTLDKAPGRTAKSTVGPARPGGAI
jgi:UDP-glucose 4-epimerase